MRHVRAPADKILGNAIESARGVPHHLFGPPMGAPRLALVGGFGEADFNGISVLSRLASFLRRIESSGPDGRWRLTAPVLVAPSANGFRWAVTGRSGRDAMPEGIEALTRAAIRRIAVRSPSEDLEYLPQVRLESPDEDEREMACLLGLPVVEQPASELADPTLISFWRRHGGESLDVAVGREGQLEPAHCEVVFGALLAFMNRVGLLQGVDVEQDEGDLHYFDASRPFDLRCGARGLFVSHRPVGAWLQAGETVGWIYDAFDGDPRNEVRTPVTGLLSAVRRQPLVEEGGVAARVLSK